MKKINKPYYVYKTEEGSRAEQLFCYSTDISPQQLKQLLVTGLCQQIEVNDNNAIFCAYDQKDWPRFDGILSKQYAVTNGSVVLVVSTRPEVVKNLMEQGVFDTTEIWNSWIEDACRSAKSYPIDQQLSQEEYRQYCIDQLSLNLDGVRLDQCDFLCLDCSTSYFPQFIDGNASDIGNSERMDVFCKEMTFGLYFGAKKLPGTITVSMNYYDFKDFNKQRYHFHEPLMGNKPNKEIAKELKRRAEQLMTTKEFDEAFIEQIQNALSHFPPKQLPKPHALYDFYDGFIKKEALVDLNRGHCSAKQIQQSVLLRQLPSAEDFDRLKADLDPLAKTRLDNLFNQKVAVADHQTVYFAQTLVKVGSLDHLDSVVQALKNLHPSGQTQVLKQESLGQLLDCGRDFSTQVEEILSQKTNQPSLRL